MVEFGSAANSPPIDEIKHRPICDFCSVLFPCGLAKKKNTHEWIWTTKRSKRAEITTDVPFRSFAKNYTHSLLAPKFRSFAPFSLKTRMNLGRTETATENGVGQAAWVMSLLLPFVSGDVDSFRSVMRVLYTFSCNIYHTLLWTGFKSDEFIPQLRWDKFWKFFSVTTQR